MFSCNRANELESCCEDDMNCACSVKVNCALPNDMEQHARFATLLDEVLFWTGNRITPLPRGLPTRPRLKPLV